MILIAQMLVIALLGGLVVSWARYSPYPSPLIRSLLPPRKRWPELEVREAVKSGKFARGYLRYFYRDPERKPPPGEGVLAPADGLITGADAKDGVRYIVIALSFWDMHVQRSPLAGRVMEVHSKGESYTDGEGRDFAFLREKRCPVQKRIVMNTAIGMIAVRLVTSLSARRIETWVRAGDFVERGRRIGRILLGSTVVLELPENHAAVQVGSRVRAGETIVARPRAASA